MRRALCLIYPHTSNKEGTTMRKATLLIAMAMILVFAMAQVALAYDTTYGADGAVNENGSMSSTVTAGPLAGTNHFDAPINGDSPHGGFTLSTDKCKQCHATHGATGTRHLLRNNKESADCAFCHSAEAAGAGANVYTENLNNGHTPVWLAAAKFAGSYSATDTRAGTIGAQTSGNIAQTLIPDSANTLENGTKAGPTGPLSLLYKSDDFGFECNSCHQQHGARTIPFKFRSLNTSQSVNASAGSVWDATTIAFYNDSNKILRSKPGRGNAQPIYGVSSVMGADGYNQPQTAAVATGTAGRAANMNIWCSSCHELNASGVDGANGATGMGSHPTYAATGEGNAVDGNAPACYNCHSANVDFPHSASGTSYALLRPGLVTANAGDRASTYDAAKLDGVCLDCHQNPSETGAVNQSKYSGGGKNAGLAVHGADSPAAMKALIFK